MEAKKETLSPIGSFFEGVFSTLFGIIIFGIMVGGIIWVARKVAGPTKVLTVKEATTNPA